MRNAHRILGAAALLMATTAAGCASAGTGQATARDEAARLWTTTCTHCHNMRPAHEFTAEQWSVIVHHMRTHGDLTRSQAVAVADYLRRLRGRAEG